MGQTQARQIQGWALRECYIDLGDMSQDPGSGPLTSKLEPLSSVMGRGRFPDKERVG